MDEDKKVDWNETIAKCLAFVCLNTEEGKKKTGVLERADFLERLGLPVEAASLLIGSSVASIKELQRLARNKKIKEPKSNGKKSKTKKH